jgi:hypothetical protein
VFRERPLGGYRCGKCIPGPRERHQKAVALRVNLLPVPFGERITKQSAVFLQDLRVPAIAEALQERSGPFDVGEEEGDRPGRQAFDERPPPNPRGRVQLGATFGGWRWHSWSGALWEAPASPGNIVTGPPNPAP